MTPISPMPMLTPMNLNAGLFVDTSGWADPILKNTPEHMAMEAYYKQAIVGDRILVTTNYVITELVALLTVRSRAPRTQVLALIARIKEAPRVQIVHIDQALNAAAWSLLEQYSDKEWSLVGAASFVVMRQLALTDAFTSDHHFTQTGFVPVPHSR